jgi:hypothetical protein
MGRPVLTVCFVGHQLIEYFFSNWLSSRIRNNVERSRTLTENFAAGFSTPTTTLYSSQRLNFINILSIKDVKANGDTNDLQYFANL